MPLHIETITEPQTANFSCALVGAGGLGKTWTLSQLPRTLTLSLRNGVRGITGQIAHVTSTADIDEAIRLVAAPKSPYWSLGIDGLDKAYKIATEEAKAGKLRRETRAQGFGRPYAIANEWLIETLWALHQMERAVIVSLHPKDRPTEWVDGRVTKVNISADLPPSALALLEREFDMILYCAANPMGGDSIVFSQIMTRKVQTAADTQKAKAPTITRQVFSRDRFRKIPNGMTLSWPNIARALQLDPETLLQLEAALDAEVA